MQQQIINLEKFRGNRSSIFTGRPQGIAARKELNIDSIDKNKDLEIVFEIPEGTTSFNPSFFLGLLYPSLKSLGLEGYTRKYKFQIMTKDLETKQVLEDNINDGLRNAVNEIEKNSGLWSFINKKN